MYVYFFVSAAVSSILLFSLPLARKVFRPAEIVAYPLLTSILVQQTHVIATLNLNWIGVQETILPFWTLTLIRVIVLPLLIFWLLCLYFAPRVAIAAKVVLTPIWLSGLYGIECFQVYLGLITFVKWNAVYSFARFGFVIAASLGFIAYFKSKMKKGGAGYHPVSPRAVRSE